MEDASKYRTPDRVFSNITREVMYKLLWHHGYVDSKHDPRGLPQYADLKTEVRATQKARLRRYAAFCNAPCWLLLLSLLLNMLV